MSEISTSRPVTFGETADSVGSRLNTIQGCRPISVKIQPTLIAASESGKLQIAIFQIHAASAWRPLRVSQRPTTAMRTCSRPRPIIQRNDQ